MRSWPLVLSLLLCACPPTDGPCKSTTDCAKSRTCCDGKCLDTENDRNNCGSCGAVCALPNVVPSCKVGRCQLQCQATFGNCNNDRSDGCEQRLADDPSNCGVCGRLCTSVNAASVCAVSLCGLGSCATGFGDCDQDTTNGCELDTRIELNHCGACGMACSLPHASSRCEASTCRVDGCDAGFGDCDQLSPNGCEVTISSDAMNCGRCGVVCGPAQVCADSRCRATELITFGGALSFTIGNTTAEVSRFDLVSNTFSTLSPATPDGSISGRQGHVATFDFARNRMVVFGGIDGAGTLAPNEVWALDFTGVPPAWRKVITTGTPPSPRFGMAAAQDLANAKWFLFGGSTELGAGLSELFTFNLATNAWAQVHGRNTANAPGDRINAMAAFDPAARVFVLEGGNLPASRTDLRELWVFDVATSSWRTPAITDGPIARAKGAFFDGSPPYLFSGIASLLMAPASMAQDFWSLDVSATPPWTQQTALGPAARFSAAAAQRDGKLYVFAGGTTGSSGQSVHTDLWSYDPTSHLWTRLNAGMGTLPSGKLSASMVGR